MFIPSAQIATTDPKNGIVSTFATGPIPIGTITFVPVYWPNNQPDGAYNHAVMPPPLDVVFPDNIMHPIPAGFDFTAMIKCQSPLYGRYTGFLWNRDWLIVPTDHAGFVRHSCASNTLMTPYGFEIAVRDIQAGEEITTSYLSRQMLVTNFSCRCGAPHCAGYISPDRDPLVSYRRQQLEAAMSLMLTVPQPMITHMDHWMKVSGQEAIVNTEENTTL